MAIVTAERDSAVARRADAILTLPSERSRPAKGARGPAGRAKRKPEPPLGSVFEQALLVVLDQVVVDLMETLGLTSDDLRRIHTTFE